MSGSSCTFKRKLCVTCYTLRGVPFIRVQSNGLPNHCYTSPRTAPAALDIDFQVAWQAEAHTDSEEAYPETQEALDSLICDIQRSADSRIPAYTMYERKGTTMINTAWGVATSGVLLMNGISAEGVDPYYPAVYGSVKDPDSVKERTDWCLAHPQG